MSTKTLTNGKKYTFNSLGLESNRCIKYEMFTLEYETFNNYNLFLTLHENNDNDTLEIQCDFENNLILNTDVKIDISLHYLINNVITDYILSFIIPTGVSSYLIELNTPHPSLSSILSNYVGVSINGLTYDTSLTFINITGINDDDVYKTQVPATISISGYEKLDNSLMKFEIDFDNAIYQYYYENEVMLNNYSTLNGDLDEPINIGMEIINNISGSIISHDLDVPSGIAPGINEIESNIGNNFLSGANSSDIDVSIIDIQPLNTSRFTIANPNTQKIITVYDDTEDGGVGFYLSKIESFEGIPNESLKLSTTNQTLVPSGYSYLICDISNSHDSTSFRFGLVINNKEIAYSYVQPQENTYFCVNLDEYYENGSITAYIEQNY